MTTDNTPPYDYEAAAKAIKTLLANSRMQCVHCGKYFTKPSTDTRRLLGAALEVLLAHNRQGLVLMHGITALTKAATQEKKAPSVPLDEARIPVDEANTACQLWYVQGISSTYYPTKIVAECAARAVFPDEDPDKRYARIYCRDFINAS